MPINFFVCVKDLLFFDCVAELNISSTFYVRIFCTKLATKNTKPNVTT